MGSAVVSTAPVGVPPTGRQRSPQLTNAPNGEWNLPHYLFGETPNRATVTVALPFLTTWIRLRRRASFNFNTDAVSSLIFSSRPELIYFPAIGSAKS